MPFFAFSEGALLNALRPLTMPLLGAGPPIPGHFVPFQRMQSNLNILGNIMFEH